MAAQPGTGASGSTWPVLGSMRTRSCPAGFPAAAPKKRWTVPVASTWTTHTDWSTRPPKNFEKRPLSQLEDGEFAHRKSPGSGLLSSVTGDGLVQSLTGVSNVLTVKRNIEHGVTRVTVEVRLVEIGNPVRVAVRTAVG